MTEILNENLQGLKEQISIMLKTCIMLPKGCIMDRTGSRRYR